MLPIRFVLVFPSNWFTQHHREYTGQSKNNSLEIFTKNDRVAVHSNLCNSNLRFVVCVLVLQTRLFLFLPTARANEAPGNYPPPHTHQNQQYFAVQNRRDRQTQPAVCQRSVRFINLRHQVSHTFPFDPSFFLIFDPSKSFITTGCGRRRRYRASNSRWKRSALFFWIGRSIDSLLIFRKKKKADADDRWRP